LPSQVDGLPTEAEELNNLEAQYCKTDEEYTEGDKMPGGVVNKGDPTGYGTSCVPVTNGDNTFMLTAAHLWWDEESPCENIRFEKYYQQKYMGEVRKYYADGDFALCDDYIIDVEFESAIKEENDKKEVAGYYTEQGVENLKSEGKEIKKMGVTTGLQTGEVEATKIHGEFHDPHPSQYCITYAGEGIKCSVDQTAKGDSGGPIYAMDEISGLDDKWAVVLSMHNFGFGDDLNKSYECLSEKDDVENNSLSSSMYYLSNEYGFEVKPGLEFD